MKYYICFIILFFFYCCKDKVEEIKIVKNVIFKNTTHLKADSLPLYQIIDLWKWKLNQEQLFIFSPPIKNGIIQAFSLPSLQFQYKFGRIGHGPDEYISTNWANTIQKNHIGLYDIPQKKLRIYKTTSDTSYKIKEYNIPIWKEELCKPYTEIQEINDSIYLFKADMNQISTLDLIDIKNDNFLYSTSPILQHDPRLNNFLFYFYIGYNHQCVVLAYEYLNRLEFFDIDSNYILTPKIVLGNDKNQHESFEKSHNFNKLTSYYTALCCTDNFVFVLNQSHTQHLPYQSIIEQYTYEGKPITRFILDRRIDNILIDEPHKKIYAYSPQQESNYIYIYYY